MEDAVTRMQNILLKQKVAGEAATIISTSDGGSLVAYNQFSRKMNNGSMYIYKYHKIYHKVWNICVV